MRTPPCWAEGQLQHFVLTSEAKSVATISIAPIKEKPSAMGITFVAVALEEQKSGYGRSLLEAAEQRIKTAGGQKVCLNAAPIAAAFYESCGYRREVWDPDTLDTWPEEAGDPPIQFVRDLLE